MTRAAVILLILASSVLHIHGQSFPNPATLSTGQGAPGTLDPIWQVTQMYSSLPPNPIGLTYSPALINNNCAPGAWVNPAALPPPVNNGNWITYQGAPCSGNLLDGYCYFRLTLNLPTNCNGTFITQPGAYTLYFDGYVDNTISDIYVNGTSTGISGGAFAAGTQLSITLPGPWVPGVNYVDVLVYNFPNGGQPNPYGLLLVANSNASTNIDTDNDGVPDINDLCPCVASNLANGCPPLITGDTIICNGETTILQTAFTGAYQWSNGGIGSSISVNPNSNTVYSLTVTEVNGTVHTGSVNVIVHPLPPAAINPSAADICQGSNVTLTASGGGTYQWGGGQQTNTLNVAPTVSTSYSVTITNSYGCVDSASSTVNVHLPAYPTVYDTICDGEIYLLPNGQTVTTAGTYTSVVWGPICDTTYTTYLTVNPVYQVQVSASICDNQTYTLPGGSVVNASGTYYDTLPTIRGCDSVVITTLTVNPTYQYTVTDSICDGYSYTLPNGSQVTTTGTYVSNLTTGLGCDSVITTQLTVLPIQRTAVYDTICDNQTYALPGGSTVNTAGVYVDTLTDVYGCDSVVTTNLTVHPTYQYTVIDSICDGYSYTLPDGTQATTTGTYTSNLTTGQGCDSVITTQLTVLPIQQTTVYDTICDDATYTLPGGTVVTATGTYVDTLTDRYGCDSIVTTALTVNPTYQYTVIDSICAGYTYTLPDGTPATASGTYTSNLTTGRGCDSIITTELTVLPIHQLTVYDTICAGDSYALPSGSTANTTGTYIDTLADVYGCDSIITTNLEVIDLQLGLSVDSVNCFGESNGAIDVNASGGLTPIVYQWSDASLSGSQASGLAAGLYALTVTDAFGCYNTDSAEVFEPAELLSTASSTDVTCFGAADGTVNVLVQGGVESYNISLNGNTSGIGSFSQLPPGTYAVHVTDANGCETNDTLVIVQPDSLALQILEPDSFYMVLGDTLAIMVSSNYDPAALYQWDYSGDLSCLDCSDPLLTGYLADSLRLTVQYPSVDTSSYCYEYYSYWVMADEKHIMFLPNVFTPNGDGVNDTYSMFGNMNGIDVFRIRIFDRSGEKVYESNNPHFAWDGSFKGTLLNPGVYVYEVRYTWLSIGQEIQSVKTGSITLVR